MQGVNLALKLYEQQAKKKKTDIMNLKYFIIAHREIKPR